MTRFKFVTLLMMISCGSIKTPPPELLPNWVGKTRAEVSSAFSHLTPKTESQRITYRDTDPVPSAASCAVIPCDPWIPGKRINCTYVFKFENDRVVKATKEGSCRPLKEKSRLSTESERE